MTAMLTEPRADTADRPPADPDHLNRLLDTVLNPRIPVMATPTAPGVRCFTTGLVRYDETGAARRILADRNTRWDLHLDDGHTHTSMTRLDKAAVCVSELVGNALRHADGVTRMLVAAIEDWLLVAITDLQPVDGIFTLSPRHFTDAMFDADEVGRGLELVDNLADRWGIRPADPLNPDAGKHVWFALALPAGA